MSKKHQVGIIGGGLAGLSLAIQLSKLNFKTVLFEKNQFPFHKLCGEYLSRESVPFLKSLGVEFESIKPAQIDQLLISSPSGKMLREELPLGAIGVSRYTLDHQLYKIAQDNGVQILENTLVKSIENADNQYIIKSNTEEYICDVVVAAYGKKSNLKTLNRKKENQNNYIGIKYHAKWEAYPEELISIHNFKDGYCGVCKLENDWVSICYLSHTNNLKTANNSIEELEKSILFENGMIKETFEKAEFIYEKPIAVSNIDFHAKELVKDGIFFCGDAAGLIAPLCGNGMSMALHASYILADKLKKYLSGEIDRFELEQKYQSHWRQTFNQRMSAGRSIQKIMRKPGVTDLGIRVLNAFPVLNKKIISLTHGKPFGYNPTFL